MTGYIYRLICFLVLASGSASLAFPHSSVSAGIKGSYQMVEKSFQLPDVSGNPFAAEIWGLVRTPDERDVRVPAFYDGDRTWRVRYTPTAPGRHTVTILEGTTDTVRQARAGSTEPVAFIVEGQPGPGFIRRDPTHAQRFVFDNGDIFYPFGMNVAWESAENFARIFRNMNQAGMNWSRIWVTHFRGLNPDWPRDRGTTLPLGQLDLGVARLWDRIITEAERNDIRVQVTLQQHGQYSTKTNPAWPLNPWNIKRGGFLNSPGEFFTDERARELTRRKYRYFVARWGYSPAIMAWELFNEVHWTDAYSSGNEEQVAQWHAEMADYLRKIDPNQHLVTTSCNPPQGPIYAAMDYYQPHVYSPEMIPALARMARFPVSPEELDKPIFVGEMGPGRMDIPGPAKEDGRVLTKLSWVGLMWNGAGAAQHWAWQSIDRNDLYPHLAGVAAFIEKSGLAKRNADLLPFTPGIKCDGVPALQALGRRSVDCALVWIFNEQAVFVPDVIIAPQSAEITIPGLTPARWLATWWDTDEGRSLAEIQVIVDDDPLVLPTPAISSDIALWLELMDH